MARVLLRWTERLGDVLRAGCDVEGMCPGVGCGGTVGDLRLSRLLDFLLLLLTGVDVLTIKLN